MRILLTWTCMILGMGMSGVALSDALSWERWVNFSWVAAPPALAQARRPATSPVSQSRFARPVPVGWAAPGLVGVRDRPDQPWRPRLAQLGLPVAAEPSRLWVGPAGEAGSSMEFDAGAPLPKVRLVKDVLNAMPDKCDERLFDTWYCGITCLYDDCEAAHGIYTLRRSIDPDGYERIHQRFSTGGDPYLSEWRVDRKWGASVSDHWMEQGKLVAVSCNGKTVAGYSNLSVNTKNPDGSKRYLTKYWVDRANKTMWVEGYEVRWEGDKPHNTFTGGSECRRELKRYW